MGWGASDERDDGGVGGASGTSERGWVSRRGKDEAHYEDQQCAIKLRQRGRSARETHTHTHIHRARKHTCRTHGCFATNPRTITVRDMQ
jgi:hypothetical protein